MIVQDIRLAQTHQVAMLSAKCKIRKIGWDTVYFKVDNAKQDYICSDASPFAAALLLPAMRQGEDLIIRGSISKQLLNGMHAIMQEVLQWNIGLKPIEIKVDALTEDTYKPLKTAMFFSGGVDSFYTYLKHKNDRLKTHRVENFILVKGFNSDIDSRNTTLWNQNLHNITVIAAAENVELIVVESNIHDLVNPLLPWGYSHGGCLAAVGLFLRTAFRRVYIASTFSAAEQIPWGTHLALDTHWSTETTTFIHDGTEATRYNKVVWQVARSPIALKYLRVCYMNVDGTYNCGVCAKCLRTMISLYLAGVLEQAKTFPSRLDLERIAHALTIKAEDQLIFPAENEYLQVLKVKNLAPDLQKAIRQSIDNAVAADNSLQQRLKAILAKFRHNVIYIDHAYSGGHVYALLSGILGKKYS